MISILQWTVLLLFYLFYLLFGAAVFMYTESGNESYNLKELHKLQMRLTLATSFVSNREVKEELTKSLEHLEEHFDKQLLIPKSYQHILETHIKYLKNEVNKSYTEDLGLSDIDVTLTSLKHAFDQRYFNDSTVSYEIGPDSDKINENVTGVIFTITSDESELKSDNKFDDFWLNIEVSDSVIENEKMWTLWNSFFFAFTDITTIGFGHLYPKTDAGQFFCLIYSILGVPLNGIVFAGLADLFASKIIRSYDKNRYSNNRRIVLDILMYLIPGILVFFFIPALVFTVAEGWSYLSSLYFTFITLSTIGFGELVAGYPSEEGSWIWPYRIMIQLWIIFGLGYLLMILSFIQKALRSKQFRAFDRKLARVLKLARALPNNEKELQKEVQKLACILTSIDHLHDKNDNNTEEGIDNFSSLDGSQYSTTTTTSFSPSPDNIKEKSLKQ